MRLRAVIESLALATASLAVAATWACPAAAQPADVGAQADTILAAAFAADGPGAAAIVTRAGQVVYAAGRGMADLDTGRAITPSTVFRTGSITKQFVAATVLTLVAEGKLSLDDPLGKFFPDWPPPGADATVRQLLNHSSGLFDYTKIPGYMLSEPTLRPNTTADLVAVMRTRPAAAPPGERWEYNNGGYVMLGAIIEQVTGMSWHEAVIERIGKPLGLTTLAYAVDAEGRPATARFYGVADGKPVPARGVHASVAHGAGGLVASVEDMARWAQALHHGRVVPPDLYREMTSPARLADGSTRPYGFGLRLQQLRGRPALVHGGAARGVDTGSIYIPSEDLFVAVFANSDELPIDASVVVQRLAALALGEPIPVLVKAEVPPNEIAPLLGAYHMDNGPPDLLFFERAGKLYLSRGEDESEAFATGEDRFFFGPDNLMWFRFVRQPDGAHAVEVHRPDRAEPVRGLRAGDVPAPFTVAPAILQSYVGTYATEQPVVTVALRDDGWLTIAAAGQGPFPLRPVSETEFRADAAGFRVVFHPENGRTDRLTLFRGARELHGARTGP